MGIRTVRSANVSNLSAAPISALAKKAGQMKVSIDTIELATTSMDDVGDMVLMLPLPSNAVLVNLSFMNDALAASGLTYDIGVYYSGVGSGQVALGKVLGDVVDANNIGTSVAFSTARVTPASLRFEADDIANLGQELWQTAGLSSDPGGILLIGLTCAVVATTPAAGTVVAIAEWI